VDGQELKVLVAYASKHGSTKGIADFIGDKLRGKGLEVDVRDVSQVQNLGSYDAYVVGSAVFIGHWMKEAKQFLSRNNIILSRRLVWLFSSGPTGKERKDAKGRDLLDPAVSGPTELAHLKEGLDVRDHRVFFGAFDTKDLGFFTQQLLRSSTIRDAIPTGDFRDWKEIEDWSDAIFRELQQIPKTAVVVH
jgi:menaquinone-dependent protoporphyrinogen oxidase